MQNNDPENLGDSRDEELAHSREGQPPRRPTNRLADNKEKNGTARSPSQCAMERLLAQVKVLHC